MSKSTKSLINVPGYFSNKSVKLSDSFVVVIDGVESYSCAGFTIPKMNEFNEEVHKFGNASQKILIPKYDILPELSIELYESYKNDDKAKNRILNIQEGTNFFATVDEGKQSAGSNYYEKGNFDSTGYTVLKGFYDKTKVDIEQLDIYVLNNRLTKYIYQYSFSNLRLTKCTPPELSYSDESLAKWSLSFVFEKFSKGAISKPAEGVLPQDGSDSNTGA